MLKTLGVPLPGEDEIAQIQQHEQSWRAIEARAAAVTVRRVAEDQKAAEAAFMADPSIENEMQVAILADTTQTLLRYAARQRVLKNYMKLIASKTAEVLMPFFQQANTALENELELRREQKTTCYSDSDPRVKECKRCVDAFCRVGLYVLLASGRECELPPMEIAEMFLPDTSIPEDGK